MNEEEILRELIKFNTVNDKENIDIINYIEKFLTNYGFKTIYKSKCLVMEIGNNSQIGFLGHTDTVPANMKEWNTNPYELEEIDNNLYGLGTCDMKGGIAAILAAVSKIDFKKYKKGIKLYFTYDEEKDFGGIKELLNKKEIFPKNMIIGEPTNNKILNGSKGLMEYRFKFTGKKAHSSNPLRGENAILKCINFINSLTNFYNKNIKNKEIKNFEVSYTTMNIGKIEGGDAINIVPDACEILIDFRIIEKEQIELIEKFIAEESKKENFDYTVLNVIEPFITKLNNNEINPCDFITEASFIEGNKIILGVGPVNPHETNEFITKQSLKKLVEQYEEIILKYLN